MHQHIMLESQGIWFQGFYMIDSSYILQNLQIYINILDMIRYVSFSLALDFSVTFSPSTHWRNSPHVPHVFWLCRYQKARVTSGLFLCTLSAYLRCSMMFHWSMTPNIKIALFHSFTHWQCLSKLIYEIIILNICLLSQKQRHIKDMETARVTLASVTELRRACPVTFHWRYGRFSLRLHCHWVILLLNPLKSSKSWWPLQRLKLESH